jgi:hypothetical protein
MPGRGEKRRGVYKLAWISAESRRSDFSFRQSSVQEGMEGGGFLDTRRAFIVAHTRAYVHSKARADAGFKDIIMPLS